MTDQQTPGAQELREEFEAAMLAAGWLPYEFEIDPKTNFWRAPATRFAWHGFHAARQSGAAGAVTEDQQRNAFYDAYDGHTRETGHKPSHYDVWLMARGLMDIRGRRAALAAPSASVTQARGVPAERPGSVDEKALDIAQAIALMWGHDRSQFVSRIQCAVIEAMLWMRPGGTQAARDVLAERQRQIEKEGWTPEHDDEHTTGAMGVAAACYAIWASAQVAENQFWYTRREEMSRELWPWDREWWRPADPRRCLVKAGALILAEIERIDRAAAPEVPT